MPAITLVAVGSRGDVQPYLALGSALAGAGADVTVATHERFRDWVGDVGVGFAQVPGDPLEVLRTAEGERWQSSGRNAATIARRLVDLAGPLADAFLEACVDAVRGADVVAFSALGIAAHHAAEAAGIPVAAAWLQPLTATEEFPHLLLGGSRVPRWARRASHTVLDQVAWRFVAGQDRRWRRTLGLEPYGFSGPFRLVRDGRLPVLYGMSGALVPPPADWPPAVQVTGAWFLPGGSLSAEVETFLGDGPPPVVVGFGSRLGEEPDAVAESAVAAARVVGVRLVLLSGWGGLGARAADDVLVVAEAPHDRLLPRAAGFVHHGGAGATHAGVRAGIPSFIDPTFADQFFWAHRVERAGAGARLASTDQAGFTDAFSRMVHQPWPGARRAAEVMAREDGTGRAVALIHSLIG
jgi:UDP:flavonoid glycosyltransferase YjiC (YdhE family)